MVFKDFMFKNECAPRQFMMTHPTVAFISRYVPKSLFCEHIALVKS